MARFRFVGTNSRSRNAIYTATAPDGSVLQHATFLTDAPIAWMRLVHHRDGVWRPSVVKPEKEDWGVRTALHSIWVECRKVS